jgi:hypothetical protein
MAAAVDVGQPAAVDQALAERDGVAVVEANRRRSSQEKEVE